MPASRGREMLRSVIALTLGSCRKRGLSTSGSHDRRDARFRTGLEEVANLSQQLFFPGGFRWRGGRRRGWLLLQAVHHFHDHENTESDNGKVDHRVDERAVGDDGCA